MRDTPFLLLLCLAVATSVARRDGFGMRFGRPSAPAMACSDLFVPLDLAIRCTSKIAAVLRGCSSSARVLWTFSEALLG